MAAGINSDILGRKLIRSVRYTMSISTMVYLSFRNCFRKNQRQGLREIFSVVASQIYYTGVQALPLMTTLALVVGALTIIQVSSQLSRIGQGNLLGNILVALIVRELGPMVTALVVIARSGTAVASELGTMKVNHEIEALESMGIDPSTYIIFPRIMGGIISVVCLAFYFSVIALLGGYLVSLVVHPLAFTYFVDSVTLAMSRADVFLFVLKNFFSGLIIFVVCCYQGLQVQESFSEVPRVTTSAVVKSILYTVGFNGFVSLMVYLQNLKELGLL